MKNCIIFGASKAGENFIRNQDGYHITCIVDNNPLKQGQYLNGIEIQHPSVLKEIKSEVVIIITSLFYQSITNQLIQEYNINKESIIYPPKRLLKKEDVNTFADTKTRNTAIKLMRILTNKLEKNNYNYFLILGTLLGLVRDGDLIPWDDDIDIGVIITSEKIEELVSLISNISIDNLNLDYLIKKDNNDKILGIDILVEQHNIYPFTLTIDFMFESNGQYFLPLDVFPIEYFESYTYIEYEKNRYRVPKDKEGFLQHVYGDWQVIRRDVTYADNTNTYNEPNYLNVRRVEK